jgi:uncharacterized membrane protein
VAILIPAALATLIGLVLLWPSGNDHKLHINNGKHAEGTVTQIVQQSCPDAGDSSVNKGAAGAPADARPCGTAAVKLTDGEGSGRTVTVELPQGPGAPSLSVGAKVVLQVPDAKTVAASNGQAQYQIIDKQRGFPLLMLAVLVALASVVFGRLRGLAALAGLAVSFVILLVFVLPAIVNGSSPLLVAVVGSATIMFVVLYLTHGPTVHTSVAILGTLASLVLTGLISVGFTQLAQLTGLADEESFNLHTAFPGMDLRGLLLAGFIIGALGVLADVTVTQAETVAELARGAHSRLDLYRSASRIGRVHVASAVNTIVLAYAGAALPLLLFIAVTDGSVKSILTDQQLAQEIVRSAVGTIGLVASVPITTALAVLVAEPGRDPLDTSDGYIDDIPDGGPDGGPGPGPGSGPGGPGPGPGEPFGRPSGRPSGGSGRTEPEPVPYYGTNPGWPSAGGGRGAPLDRPPQGWDPRP